jgi:hypothetical protein
MKSTVRLLAFLAFTLAAQSGFALPPCRGSDASKWNNCVGNWTSPAGDTYQGDFKSGTFNGYGTYFAKSNGFQYVGEFKGGSYVGQGSYTLPGGDKFSGEFQDSKRNGLGTYTFANGSKFVGEYKDDKPNGVGTFSFVDGRLWVGDWKDDKPHGNFIKYASNKTIEVSGIFEYGDLKVSQYIDPNLFRGTGRNRLARADSDEERAERLRSQTRLPACIAGGTWDKCLGTLAGDDGSKYVGEWADGKYHGQGVFVQANRNKYVGEFKFGNRDGQGVYTWADGQVWLGEWKEGEAHGLMIKYAANKTIESSGIFDNSKFISSQYIDPNSFTRIAQGPEVAAGTEALRLEIERKSLQIEEERRRIEEEKRQVAIERQRIEAQKNQLQIVPDNRRRLALVIGNNNYSSMPVLNNAVNDAKSIGDALKQANFEVLSYTNLDKRRMEEALRNFTSKLGKDDVGLFYFSGHGIQADNRNFLIPVAENVKKTSEVPYEGIDVNRVMANLQDAKNALNIVVLDACRSSLPDARGGMSRGLTVTDAPQGSIIAYATSPGKTASDGDGGNSPYTKNLIRAMQRKGVPIEQVFKEVRQAVMRETNGEQTPSETSYLVGDFYFRP